MAPIAVNGSGMSPNVLLSMPKTTTPEQDAQAHQALGLTFIGLLMVFALVIIVGAFAFLIMKIKEAVGVQWHPDLGEFEETKRSFKKRIMEFPKDVKEFFTPVEPYVFYADEMEAQDPNWARTYLRNTYGLQEHAANVHIPQVRMAPKGAGTPVNTPELDSEPFTSTAGGDLHTHGSVDITEFLKTPTAQSTVERKSKKEKADKGKAKESPVFSIAVGEIFPRTPPPSYYSPPVAYFQPPAAQQNNLITEADLTEMRFEHLSLPIEWKMYVPDREIKRGSDESDN